MDSGKHQVEGPQGAWIFFLSLVHFLNKYQCGLMLDWSGCECFERTCVCVCVPFGRIRSECVDVYVCMTSE